MATGGSYVEGYDGSRFVIAVSDTFRCPICLLVLKDPVMCKNEHSYCSSCIKEHLKNNAFCPTCRVPLSVEELRRSSRMVIDYLSELKIHCDFHSRGCNETVQVRDLTRHVENCGFSPVQCSNEGCNVLVNKRGRLHHEAELCEFRKLKCHDCDCGQLKVEMKEMKNEMKGLIEELKGIKEEMKEMKQIVLNAVQNAVAGNKDSKDEMKSLKQSSQVRCSLLGRSFRRRNAIIPNLSTAEEHPHRVLLIPGQEELDLSVFEEASLADQKQILGNHLFPIIQRTQPYLAGKITGMFLELENAELFHLLQSSTALEAKIQEALSVLRAYQMQE